MSDPKSPVDALLEELQNSLLAKKRDALSGVQTIALALETYRRAVEERIVTDFVNQHRVRGPSLSKVTAERAARLLLDAVRKLPELADSQRTSPSPAKAAAPAPASSVEGSSPLPAPPVSLGLPTLTARSQGRKVVIVGALSGRKKESAVPEHLRAHTEWVDTERDGVHAIGNLPQRIRQGRVSAVVICDRAVQHKHTEPVVAAARTANVPVGFAGKGGLSSIERALESIEQNLAS